MTLSLDLFIQMSYAIGIGVLIGLERSMGAGAAAGRLVGMCLLLATGAGVAVAFVV